jgi:hypothetical protein
MRACHSTSDSDVRGGDSTLEALPDRLRAQETALETASPDTPEGVPDRNTLKFSLFIQTATRQESPFWSSSSTTTFSRLTPRALMILARPEYGPAPPAAGCRLHARRPPAGAGSLPWARQALEKPLDDFLAGAAAATAAASDKDQND